MGICRLLIAPLAVSLGMTLSSASEAEPRSGIEIENAAPALLPPVSTRITRLRYGWTHNTQVQDMNNDGRPDFIYGGAMIPENGVDESENTGGACGDARCLGRMPGPTLYLSQPDGTWSLSDHLVLDRRPQPGQSLSGQILIADYNGDGVKDIFIADVGLGTHRGFRDSYFLSQPNGTWLESSRTHFANPGFINFNHGAATGDIDGDGDFDLVLSDLNPAEERSECENWHECFFFCRKNDGQGRMTLAPCGGVDVGGLELADMDGDGDLDAVVGGNELEWPDNEVTPTGIIENDGTGFFDPGPHWDFPAVVPLPRRPGFFVGIPEVSAGDLDGDGDLDIVTSRTGILYAGTALQVIENLGGGTFRDRGLIVLERPPADYVPITEGNEWNAWIEAIRFKDFDRDGRLDIYTISNVDRHYGVVLMHRPGWRFSRLDPDDPDNPIRFVKAKKLKR